MLFTSSGARNWPFLTLTAASAPGGGEKEIRLAAQEGGDLQDVDDFRGGLDLGDVVDVGEHRAAEALLNSGENF